MKLKEWERARIFAMKMFSGILAGMALISLLFYKVTAAGALGFMSAMFFIFAKLEEKYGHDFRERRK